MVYKSTQKAKAKPKYKKGLWSPEEDNKLRSYVLKHGHDCWSVVPIVAGLQRDGKSCRLRWINYLRPGLKRGKFSKQEEETILTLKKKQVKYEGTHYASSSLDSTGSPYVTKPIRSIAGYVDSTETAKQLPENVGYSIPQNSDFHSDAYQSCFPKLLFSEWLLTDHVYARSYANSADSGAVGNCSHHGSSSECRILSNLLSRNGTLTLCSQLCRYPATWFPSTFHLVHRSVLSSWIKYHTQI